MTENDPHSRGIVILGLGADEAALAESFEIAARYPLVKGFAVGRTIFGRAAEGYISGNMAPADAVRDMAERYGRLAGIWDRAREKATGEAA